MIISSKLYKLCVILLIIAFSLPILISITYVVPAADDFCNGFNLEKLRAQHSLIMSALFHSKNIFMTWQGSYFGTFVLAFLPNIHNSYFALRAILLCCFIVFVSGIFLYSLIFTRSLLKFSDFSSYIVSGIFTILSINITSGGEWFTWFTGCSIYQVPMICYLYAAISLILFSIKRNYFLLIISIVLSFFGAGGALLVTSLGSSFLLLTLVFVIDKKNYISRQNFLLIFPLFMSVLGGLVNSLAPGNFIRYLGQDKSGELHILRAIKDSLLTFQEHLVFLNSFSVVFYLGILFIVLYKNETLIISLKQFLFFNVFSCISIVLVAFPFLLGYATSRIDTTTRIAYTFDFAIIFYLIVFTISLTCYVRNNEFVDSIFFSFSKLKKVTIWCLVLVCFFYFHSGFKNGYAYKTFRDLKHGYIQEATSSLAYVYNELDKNRNSSAVELSIKPFNTSSIYLPEISKNPEHWFNICYSRYFGAKSCSINNNDMTN